MKKKLNIILNIAIILTIANITYNLYLSKTAYKQIDITASTKIISSQNINYIKYYKDYYQNEDRNFRTNQQWISNPSSSD